MSSAQERTAMGHARAALQAAYPAAPFFEARQTGGRWSRGEDLFGCGDLAVLMSTGGLYLVQVKYGLGHVSEGRHKIVDRIVTPLSPFCEEPSVMRLASLELSLRLEVWAWLPRKHFRVWRWSWRDAAWSERATLDSPNLCARRT